MTIDQIIRALLENNEELHKYGHKMVKDLAEAMSKDRKHPSWDLIN